MKKSFLILSCLAFSILTSCNNTTSETEEPTTDSITSATPDTVAFQEQMPGEITTTTSDAATAGGAAPADGLNPAHGMPGHRCDISVGEPLSSAPKNAPQSITTSPSTDNSGIQGATTIQVPPPSSTPAASQPIPSAEKSLGTPMVGGPSTNTTTTAPGMNPPHGQPGHDCAVAVGAPLKK